ncbi:MAG: hypothetical protein US31_C0017G0023 [Berkelbacteria bacterium GW2011_GWA1_36_9]|uniref:HAD family hydrolase n=1 Tax=Berkelbacteria bacterium GW2011_GWA1_36_9 TaxID=1618331 RepID=A0A0G0I0A1_9BACT|nr:MAG: hypothetical protein US31_C0017G0023 [Berkelbacteria bacterium GW2011_GWA1_36_9]
MNINGIDVKGIVFDLDGTLVWTREKYIHKVIKQTLGKFGRISSRKERCEFWYKSNRDLIIQDAFGVDPHKFWEEFQNYDTLELRQQYVKVYSDAIYSLGELKKSGIRTGILTGSPEKIMEMEVGLLNHDFDALVSANSRNGIPQKPNGVGLEICLTRMCIPLENCVIVGN